jgi:hypothetical protein
MYSYWYRKDIPEIRSGKNLGGRPTGNRSTHALMPGWLAGFLVKWVIQQPLARARSTKMMGVKTDDDIFRFVHRKTKSRRSGFENSPFE